MVENRLTAEEVLEIENLAKAARRNLDLGMGPIGEKIFTVLRDNNIVLLYFCLDKVDYKSMEAFYLAKYNNSSNKYSYYIALNTKVSLDLQIFNLCHEYYHHIDDVEKNLHLMRFGGPDDEWLNTKANRFAAEFLLPTETLTTHIRKSNRGKIDISKWKILTLYRFIAQIQIDYQVPYRMIIKRLREIEAIDEELKNELLKVEERNKNSKYYLVALNIDEEEFIKLNTSSYKTGVDNEVLNIMLLNYDENAISLDSIIRDLKIFNKNIEDFGYTQEVQNKDIDEMFSLLEED